MAERLSFDFGNKRSDIVEWIRIRFEIVRSLYPSDFELLDAAKVKNDPNDDDRKAPRLIPVDKLRRSLLQYLLCRLDSGCPWLFLSKLGEKKLDQDNINDV